MRTHRIYRPCQCEQCAAAVLQPAGRTEPSEIRRVPWVWPQVQPLDTTPVVMRPRWQEART